MTILPRGLLLVPFVAQGAAMAWDELYFHRRRGLGKWEKIGHPIDTLSFLACLALVGFERPTPLFFTLYAASAVFSTLLITKDEWVHARSCEAGEHWLHSLLFVLHPVVLVCAASLWPALSGNDAIFERKIFMGFFFSVVSFLLYQIFYWNLLNEAPHAIR